MRFIYAPAFDLPKIDGARSYRFTVRSRDGESHTFTASQASAPLTPVWEQIPEGCTTLTVRALDGAGKEVAMSGQRVFYRSPGFSGDAGTPPTPYAAAGRSALKAIFDAQHVQAWLKDGKPDRQYARYCYPNKVIGGLVRAMSAYSTAAESDKDRAAAVEIARRAGDYLLSLRLPDSSPYAHVPPTYANRM